MQYKVPNVVNLCIHMKASWMCTEHVHHLQSHLMPLHLFFFQILNIKNKAAANTHVQVFLWIFSSGAQQQCWKWPCVLLLIVVKYDREEISIGKNC